MGGGRAEVNVGALLPKRATLIGTVLRPRPLEEKIALTQRFGREVLPWFASGALRPVIDSRFPLDQAAEAHRRMESNANVGKIVLEDLPLNRNWRAEPRYARAGAPISGRVTGFQGSGKKRARTRAARKPGGHAGRVGDPGDRVLVRREELGDEEEPEQDPRRDVEHDSRAAR